MKIFEVTNIFLKEEKYSLTDQIRCSSRSNTSNITEACSKKIYMKSFISKPVYSWLRLLQSVSERHKSERDLNFLNDEFE